MTATAIASRVSRGELASAAERRAQSLRTGVPQPRRALAEAIPVSEARKGLQFPAQLRANKTRYNGQDLVHLQGIASVVGVEYEMWDFFGPYTESVRVTAFDNTLAAGPDVSFLLNHEGMVMARTVAMPSKLPTLLLGMVSGPEPTDNGLGADAYVNPKRQDVSDLVIAVDDGLVTEMSFAFMIIEGWWSEDYESFEIAEVDINRGDVSAVNYGANPYTSIAARQREVINVVRLMPAPGAQGVLREIIGRGDVDLTAARGAAPAVAAAELAEPAEPVDESNETELTELAPSAPLARRDSEPLSLVSVRAWFADDLL